MIARGEIVHQSNSFKIGPYWIINGEVLEKKGFLGGMVYVPYSERLKRMEKFSFALCLYPFLSATFLRLILRSFLFCQENLTLFPPSFDKFLQGFVTRIPRT